MSRLPGVTDHAVLKYLERVMGLDVEGVRARIAREARSGLAAGASALVVDGMTFVIKPGRVVTVVRGRLSDDLARRKSPTPLGGVRK